MRGNWWRWLVYAFAAWTVATTIFAAINSPWRWTLNQYLLVFFALLAVAILATWLVVWVRGGRSAVKERWAIQKQRRSAPISKAVYRWSLAFWIVVAIGLVFLFNTMPR